VAAARIRHDISRDNKISSTLRAASGATLTVVGTLDKPVPVVSGTSMFTSNPALNTNLWACAVQEAQYRRLRAPEKRSSHRKQSDRQAKEALRNAGLVEHLGPISTYICQNCGALTTPYAAPRCNSLANRRSAASVPRYCAEHCHEIPSFRKLDARLAKLEDYEAWRDYDKHNLAQLVARLICTRPPGRGRARRRGDRELLCSPPELCRSASTHHLARPAR
jgi:hypothetical protein